MRGNRVEDALVLFVDIAPGLDELSELAEYAARIIVLDHHVTNQKNFDQEPELLAALRDEGHEIHFDMNHSGAILTWQYLFPGERAPDLLNYIEDQDIWNWQLPKSAEVNAAISSYPQDFDTWTTLVERDIDDLAREGESIVRTDVVEVERAIRNPATISLGDRRVEAINARTRRSAIGHALAERKTFGHPWGCVYRIEGSKVHATLYSIGDFDVSKIAGEYGGGGHKNAAGFSLPLTTWVSIILG
jgi:oligoribonuclease NrnB/cAMP/cGMP phosphodiesterase (DHH superfamily)